MLTVFVFDEREAGQQRDMRGALDRVAESELVWIALRGPTEEEVAAVQDALELSDEQTHRLLEQPRISGERRRAHACDAVRGQGRECRSSRRAGQPRA